MTTPFIPIDTSALDLTSEAGQENALMETITILNSVLDLLNGQGTTVPLIGVGNSGGLLSASQKLTLTGGGNADALHTHSGLTGTGGTPGADPIGAFLLAASDSQLAQGRVLQGIAGQIELIDLGAGSSMSIGLANSGAVAGSYTKGTYDSKGRLISGGVLIAADIPTHQHSAGDLTSGLIPAARFGVKSVVIAALDPGVVTDGWLATAQGNAIIMSPPPVGTGEVNTASNVNTTGTGVFKQKTGINLEFRGITSLAGLLATLNAGNNSIDLAPDWGTGTNQIPRGDHNHDTRYYQKSEVDAITKVLSVVTKTANYTATTADQYVRCDSSSGNITMTLPDGSTNIGKVLCFKRINISANIVHVVPAGADKIDGIYTDWELWTKNEFVVLVGVVGGWEVSDSSGSQFLVDQSTLGAAKTVTIKPNMTSFKITATVNNGILTLTGMLPGQAAHIQLSSGAGGFATSFAVSGQGAVKWPGGVTQPPTTTAAGKIDDVYATYNGTDTLFSYRGQGY